MTGNNNPAEVRVEVSPDTNDDGDHYAVVRQKNGNLFTCVIESGEESARVVNTESGPDGTLKFDHIEDFIVEESDVSPSDVETYVIAAGDRDDG